ncbi:MAG: exodeoxyribonuclease VII large subunit, partial [Lachnospiraceae bacterium]|nr:exodeoxyribonuclease VII large subunit [Lachnospiraceae bacterium]
MKARAYSVEQVNKYIRGLFENEPFLQDIRIRGEISNLKYHSSGHIYFDIKDESGKLSAAMFRNYRRGLSVKLRDGDEVIVTGDIDVYTKNGTYQCLVRRIEATGEGDLYARFERLKRELSEMGMFAEEYKKPLPPYVFHLGIVTAPTGAAVRDMIRIARRRNPGIRITLYPALVQGEGAAESIAEGIAVL